MKKLILILVIFVQGFTAPAQSFNQSFDINSYTLGSYNIEVISVDSILVFAPAIAANKLFIQNLLLNQQGDTTYIRKFELNNKSVATGWANSTAPTKDGNFIMGGGWQDTATFGYLMKFNPQGDTLWTRTFGDTTNFHTFRQAKELANGDFIVVGQNINGGWLVRTDSLGNQKWSRTYSGFGDVQSLTSVFPTTDGGFILGGRRRHLSPSPYNNNNDQLLIKVDSAGSTQWSYIHDTPYDDPNAYVIQTLDGNYVFACAVSNQNTNRRKAALVKVDANGNLLWEKTYGTQSGDHALVRVMELADSSLLAVGTRDVGPINYGLMVKTNAHGDSLWVGEYEHDISWRPSSNELWDVAPMADGGFVACGETRGRPNGGAFQQDAWVIRVDSMGCILANCLVGNESLKPKAKSLKIYPNPSSGQLWIQASEKRFQQVVVIDLQGRQLLKQDLSIEQSKHKLALNKLENGVYFIQLLDQEGEISSHKIVIQH